MVLHVNEFSAFGDPSSVHSFYTIDGENFNVERLRYTSRVIRDGNAMAFETLNGGAIVLSMPVDQGDIQATVDALYSAAFPEDTEEQRGVVEIGELGWAF